MKFRTKWNEEELCEVIEKSSDRYFNSNEYLIQQIQILRAEIANLRENNVPILQAVANIHDGGIRKMPEEIKEVKEVVDPTPPKPPAKPGPKPKN
jgi:hypothetical protein